MASSHTKTALITGGGKGLGAAIAKQLGDDGFRLLLVGRSQDTLDRQVIECANTGAIATAIVCDLCETDNIARLTEQIGSDRIDVLVNNAGIATSAPLPRTNADNWQQTFDVNVRAPFLLIQAFLPAMVKRGTGHVVNVASTAGLRGAAYVSAYSASKHALVGLTRSVAEEYRTSGVSITAICPGYIDTEICRSAVRRLADSQKITTEQALQKILHSAHQQRLLQPGEVAAMVGVLCSDTANGLPGACVEMCP